MQLQVVQTEDGEADLDITAEITPPAPLDVPPIPETLEGDVTGSITGLGFHIELTPQFFDVIARAVAAQTNAGVTTYGTHHHEDDIWTFDVPYESSQGRGGTKRPRQQKRPYLTFHNQICLSQAMFYETAGGPWATAAFACTGVIYCRYKKITRDALITAALRNLVPWSQGGVVGAPNFSG